MEATTAATIVATAVADGTSLTSTTILEAVATLILMVIGLGIRVAIQYFRARLSNEDVARLEQLSKMAVGAAEEIGAREEWTSAQKLTYAQDIIKAGFPKVDKDMVDAAIHAALAFAQVGNTGASDLRRTAAQ